MSRRLAATALLCLVTLAAPSAARSDAARPGSRAPVTAVSASRDYADVGSPSAVSAANSVEVVQTDLALSQDMAPQPGLTFSTTQPSGVPLITVNDQIHYQQFKGIGAAMTDSSAWLIGTKMSTVQRASLIQELFGQASSTSGLPAPPIHLNFLRVGVAATGAMTVTPAYSYDDNPPGGTDPMLAQFSIAHDTPYIIPTLQQVLQVDPSLQVLASPWSSPGWMKGNNSLGNQNNSGTLLAADYGTYASYLVKFIQAYTKAGIPIQTITPANEPTTATPYPGLNFPESDEANFIANYLQPALQAAALKTKIYGTDLSWDQFSRYASPLLADPSARPKLAGTAWHCYFGSPAAMTQLHQQATGKDQIVDECSPEITSRGKSEGVVRRSFRPV